MTDAKEFITREFVFQGQRRGADDKRFVQIAVIEANGTLGKPMLFSWSKAREKYVGNVYSCEFSTDGNTVRGLEKAQWKHSWSNEGDRIEWDAKDREAKTLHAHALQEKKAGALDEFERILKPLRKQYSACIARFDYGAADAIERAVMQTLRMPLRKSEGG